MASIFDSSPWGPLSLTISMSLAVAAAFPIGALSSLYVKFPTRMKAGIFLAAVTFSLIEEAVKLGSVLTTAVGFAIGASTFSIVRYYIQKKQKKQGSSAEQSENKQSQKNSSSLGSGGGGGGKAVIIGTFADSHPETIIIGIILGLGLPRLVPTVLTLFLGNVTATIEGTRRMIIEGESRYAVLRRWDLMQLQ